MSEGAEKWIEVQDFTGSDQGTAIRFRRNPGEGSFAVRKSECVVEGNSLKIKVGADVEDFEEPKADPSGRATPSTVVNDFSDTLTLTRRCNKKACIPVSGILSALICCDNKKVIGVCTGLFPCV